MVIRKLTGAAIVAEASGVTGLIGSGLSAQAGYVVTLEQVGNNVVATGIGPIDLTDLSSAGPGLSGARVSPNGAEIITGPVGSEGLLRSDLYTGYTGPTSFGSGGEAIPNSGGSGDIVGIGMSGIDLVVPSGYASDSPLSDTATYINQTFASLGVIPGTYEWTWGNGANQNFTLNVGNVSTVPAPPIGHGPPAALAIGGLMAGAGLWEGKKSFSRNRATT